MRPVTISSKYRITIPSEIREQFGIKPGDKAIFIPYENSLRIVFVSSIKDAQGFLQGMDTNVDREEEDEER
jgi:AbrB family looped-hinge helix DNA binding protein